MVVVITRPVAQSAALAERVAQAGFEPMIFPAIEIAPVEDTQPLCAAFERLDRYRLVVFVSPNAIGEAFRHWSGTWPHNLAIAVMGPGSLGALAERGISAPPYRIFFPGAEGHARTRQSQQQRHTETQAEPLRFDSESLLGQLDLDALRGGEVLIVKGNGGRPWLAERLEERGITVDQVESYRRSRHLADGSQRSALEKLVEQSAEATWIVTSSEAIQFLIESMREVGGEDAVAWLKASRWVVPHRRIAENATTAGVGRVVLSGAGDDGIVRALE